MTILPWARMLLLVALAVPVMAGEAEPPLNRGIGERVADFTLKNVLNDQEVSLYSFRGKRAGVIVFTGTSCPVGDLYMPRLVELARKYEPQGVVFLAINSNESEDAQAVAEHARKFGLTFPVLKDSGRVVADELQVHRTCEALLLDDRAILRYRGAIDDQYGLGTRKEAPRSNYLVEALEAVLAGRAVDNAATTVVGCPIEGEAVKTLAGQISKLQRVRPPSKEQIRQRDQAEGPLPDVGPVNYAEHVASILQNRCQNCHRPNQVAPFALLTYKDAKRWATSIYEVVESRRMPPWHADPRYGHFSNDRRLTARERATLLAWVEQGAPEGDPTRAPAPRTFPEGWTIGTPDVVFELPEPYTVKADGFLNYQRFRVPTNFQEDVWVQAAEARPGDRSVVHHIIGYVLPDPKDPRVRLHLCGYAPGDMPSVYPPGVAKHIPAGSVLEFEMHYTPIGKIRIDRSQIGLILAKRPVEREAYTVPIARQAIEIPPHAANHEESASRTFRENTVLLAFMPHMHLRGKDFRYDVVYPDGRKETLLSVPAYDFGWQSYYTLAEPLKLPAGTRIDCTAHYDNSENNPANPDPTKTVRWGDQTYEEMLIGYVDVVIDRPPGELPRRPAGNRSAVNDVQRVLRAIERRAGSVANRPAG